MSRAVVVCVCVCVHILCSPLATLVFFPKWSYSKYIFPNKVGKSPVLIFFVCCFSLRTTPFFTHLAHYRSLPLHSYIFILQSVIVLASNGPSCNAKITQNKDTVPLNCISSYSQVTPKGIKFREITKGCL
jgi:hypothetical protein